MGEVGFYVNVIVSPLSDPGLESIASQYGATKQVIISELVARFLRYAGYSDSGEIVDSTDIFKALSPGPNDTTARVVVMRIDNDLAVVSVILTDAICCYILESQEVSMIESALIKGSGNVDLGWIVFDFFQSSEKL